MNATSIDLRPGILAAQSGKHAPARAYFINVLKADPRNEMAWLWLSKVMPTTEEALRCVEHLLALNPQHAKAKEARELLRVRLIVEEASVLKPSTPPSSTLRGRYLLGEALVEAGVLRSEQLKTALAEQAKRTAQGKPERLGEILLRLKMITQEQLEAALAAQAESAVFKATDDQLGRFGEFLVRRRLITIAQLQQAVVRQQALKRIGRSVRIGEVLVECGYLSSTDLNRVVLEWQDHYNAAFV